MRVVVPPLGRVLVKVWRTGADVVLEPEVMVVSGAWLDVLVVDVMVLSVVAVDSGAEVVVLGGSVELGVVEGAEVELCSEVVVCPAVVEAGAEVEDVESVVEDSEVLLEDSLDEVDSVEVCSVLEGVDVVDCSGVVEVLGSEDVDEEGGGVVDDPGRVVLLLPGVSSCLLAIWTIAEATEGSFSWIASMASRSEGKTPCWYLSGR